MTSLRLELSAVLFAWTTVACSSSPSTAPASPPITEDTAPGDDADETTPPACQADLATDPKNCGACGHDCAAGACIDGRCAPAVFATNASQVTVMTVAGDTLVWSQEGQYVPGFGTGSIQRCALDSCDAPEILVEKISKPWIAVAGSKLYGTNDTGFVFSCSLDKACKAPKALVDLRTKSGFLVGVAATASNVFFINRGTTDSTGNWPSAGNVRRIPKTGGDASVVASGEKDPRVLAVGPHAIYWSSQSGKIIRRITK